MKHFAICVFNRATYSRCLALIEVMGRHPDMKLTCIVSGGAIMETFGNAATYINNAVPQVEYVQIPIDYPDFTGYSSAVVASEIANKFAHHFATRSYDAVIVVADRFETLPAALAASYQNIPIIHLQGGEVTSNIDEKVRHAVTKLSDLHFVATEQAKKYVIAMGEHKYRAHKTGCPSLDLLRLREIKRWKPREKYMISIFHPETNNVDEAANQTQEVLAATYEFGKRLGYRCYWYWPNPDPGRQIIADLLETAKTEMSPFLIKAVNQEPESFLKQLAGAALIVGNSSCGLRECSYLGVPAINVGDRQSLRERSWNVIDVPADRTVIVKAMLEQPWKYKRSELYGNGHASEYIVKWLETMALTIKEPISYPQWPKFREEHIGEGRYVVHQKRNFGKRTRPKEILCA